MARGDRRADELLVPLGDMQYCAPPGRVQPLVAIADEEVGVESGEVEGNVSHAVGAVDDGEDVVLATHGDEALEGEAYPRQGGDGVEEGDADSEVLVDAARDGLGEGIQDVTMSAGEGEAGALAMANLAKLGAKKGREGFEEGEECFLNGAVEGVEVEDYVGGGVGQVAEDGVDSGGGVLGEDDFRGGG